MPYPFRRIAHSPGGAVWLGSFPAQLGRSRLVAHSPEYAVSKLPPSARERGASPCCSSYRAPAGVVVVVGPGLQLGPYQAALAWSSAGLDGVELSVVVWRLAPDGMVVLSTAEVEGEDT